MTAETDAGLATQADSRAAFPQLVDNCKVLVYNFCYRMLGSAQEADEAAQEVFVTAYGQQPHQEAGQFFTVSLLAIARRICLNRLSLPQPWWLGMEDDGLAYFFMQINAQPKPTEHDTEVQGNRNVQAMLDRLSPDARCTMILRHCSGRSCEDIAAISRKTPEAVRRQLHEACESLVDMSR